jgi:hypothetical protein
MEKLIVKYNSGYLAILCSCCSKILKVGYQFTDEERKYIKDELEYLPPQYCEQCKSKQDDVS